MEVVVRAIGSDLHMDLHGRRPDDAPGRADGADRRSRAVVITPDTLELAEGYVEVKSLGPVPVKGLADPLALLPPPATSISPTGRNNKVKVSAIGPTTSAMSTPTSPPSGMAAETSRCLDHSWETIPFSHHCAPNPVYDLL
jgi:hypothetical protein